jgi:hypothetical protein
MNFCFCHDTTTRTSRDDGHRNSILLLPTKEQVKNKIETQYQKYVSGELKCTTKQAAVITNNYNSRRKIDNLL